MYTTTIGSDYGYGASAGLGAMMGVYIVVWLAVCVVMIVAMWKVFTKAGKPGWAAIIPFYNTYTLFDMVYGNGWKFLFLLVPFYNIYVGIKMYIDLASAFGKSGGFAVGLIFLNPIFMCILGFGPAVFEPKCYTSIKKQAMPTGTARQMSDEEAKAALKAKLQSRK